MRPGGQLHGLRILTRSAPVASTPTSRGSSLKRTVRAPAPPVRSQASRTSGPECPAQPSMLTAEPSHRTRCFCAPRSAKADQNSRHSYSAVRAIRTVEWLLGVMTGGPMPGLLSHVTAVRVMSVRRRAGRAAAGTPDRSLRGRGRRSTGPSRGSRRARHLLRARPGSGCPAAGQAGQQGDAVALVTAAVGAARNAEPQQRHRADVAAHLQLDAGFPVRSFPGRAVTVQPGTEQLIGQVAAADQRGSHVSAEHRSTVVVPLGNGGRPGCPGAAGAAPTAWWRWRPPARGYRRARPGQSRPRGPRRPHRRSTRHAGARCSSRYTRPAASGRPGDPPAGSARGRTHRHPSAAAQDRRSWYREGDALQAPGRCRRAEVAAPGHGALAP